MLIEVPGGVATNGAYTNPFNPGTTLGFAVSTEQHVRATLHDIQGRLIMEVANVRALPHET